MNNLISFLIGFCFGYLAFNEFYAAISFGLLFFIFSKVLFESNNQFVFREWTLLLYCINYLVAPSITYGLDSQDVNYAMKISSDDYFQLAIPAFLLFSLGVFILPTQIFKINFDQIKNGAFINEKFLVRITILGIALRYVIGIVPSDLGFLLYLISLIRFVSAFALFSISKRFWYWSLLVLLLELFNAIISGMYHDAIMWIIFFGLYFVYAMKPKTLTKIIGGAILIIIVLFVQSFKAIYRSEVWYGTEEANLITAYNLGSENANSNIVLGVDNLLSTLNRGNQAWIFASTVDNMDNLNKFQGLDNVNKYLEAALLPRFLAPNKLSSGDKDIFNKFSGHEINQGTSMGLGIFADGYIAYGIWGVYVFGFALGIIFSLTFKLVERWSKVSPFYVLLLLPLLNYAVRPDCELQTTINHLVKGIFIYGILVFLTRKRFSLESQENKRKLIHLNLASKK